MNFFNKILCVFTATVLLLSLLACEKKTQNNNENHEQDIDTPAPNEEESIIQTAVDFLNQTETIESPGALFSHFDGDFQISEFKPNSENNITGIKRSGAVTRIEYPFKDIYAIESQGHMFYAADYHDTLSEFTYEVPLSADAPDHSTIFNVFGMDTSEVYNGNETDKKPYVFTADMLTLSEDKTYCTVSKDYLDYLADTVCQELKLTDAQKRVFMENYTGTGTYRTSPNQAVFEISFSDDSIGNVKKYISVSIDTDGKFNAISRVEHDKNVKMINEIEFKDAIYVDGKPVSATIIKKYAFGVSSFHTIKTTTFNIDCTNPQTPKCTALYDFDELECKLIIDPTSKSYQFTYLKGGATIGVFDSITAKKITFDKTDKFPAVPQRVTDVITSYINTYLKK